MENITVISTGCINTPLPSPQRGDATASVQGHDPTSMDAPPERNALCPLTTRVVVRLPGKGENSRIKGILQVLKNLRKFVNLCPFNQGCHLGLWGPRLSQR